MLASKLSPFVAFSEDFSSRLLTNGLKRTLSSGSHVQFRMLYSNDHHSPGFQKFFTSKFLGSTEFCSPVNQTLKHQNERFSAGKYATASSQSEWNEFKWSDEKRPRVCILGGGFGGLYTALKLNDLIWSGDCQPQILLIDQSDRFVFKPLLYEIISREVDQWEIAPRFTDLLAGKRVNFLQDKVLHVNPFDLKNVKTGEPYAGKIYLESGKQITYDWLVLALGSETKKDMVPGALEFALPFNDLDDALKIEEEICRLEQEYDESLGKIKIAVVGGGYAGVELSSTIAHRLNGKAKIMLIDPREDICLNAPSSNRETAKKILMERNVELVLQSRVKSIEKSDAFRLNLTKSVHDTDKEEFIVADLILWTVGNRAVLPQNHKISETENPTTDFDTKPNPDAPGFPVNFRGQADTESTLRVRNHPRVFALGDSAACYDSEGRPLPATAQVAFQQADYVAWNLWASINDRPLLPFRYQHLGEMITLGDFKAAVSLGNFEGLGLDGLSAYAARRLAYLYRLPTNEHRIKVGINWMIKSTNDLLNFAQAVLPK